MGMLFLNNTIIGNKVSHVTEVFNSKRTITANKLFCEGKRFFKLLLILRATQQKREKEASSPSFTSCVCVILISHFQFIVVKNIFAQMRCAYTLIDLFGGNIISCSPKQSLMSFIIACA